MASIPQSERAQRVRDLFRANPLAAEDSLAIIDPISGLAIRLVPAFDDEGEITMLPEAHADLEAEAAPSDISDSPNTSLSPSLVPTTPVVSHVPEPPSSVPCPPLVSPQVTGSPCEADGWAKGSRSNEGGDRRDDVQPRQPVSAPERLVRAGRQPTAAFLRRLPSGTQLTFDSQKSKAKASKGRWDKYKHATTIAELKELNPSPWFVKDLAYDVTKGLVDVAGLLFNTEDGEFAFSRVGGPPTPSKTASLEEQFASACKAEAWEGDLSSMLKLDLMAPVVSEQAAELKQLLLDAEQRAHDATLKEDMEHGRFDSTVAALQKLEDLEDSRGPLLSAASAQAMLDATMGDATWEEGWEPAMFAEEDEDVFVVIGDEDQIKGLRAARKSSAWEGPGGWKEATAKDLKQGEDMQAWHVVPRQRYHDCVAKYGADRVSIKRFVYTLKVKRNMKSEITKRKARACVGDCVKDGRIGDTYSPTVAPSSRKLEAALLALWPGAVSRQNDVKGAYYYGTPVHPDDGGRVLFCEIPDEFEEFGYDLYAKDGSRNLLEITGNVPGRQDAGRIWGEVYTDFLVNDCNLMQSVVDRRLFYQRTTDGGLLIVAVYVDDSWSICTDVAQHASFDKKWCNRFAMASDVTDTDGDFVGARIIRCEDGSVELTSEKLYEDLEHQLVPYPVPNGFTIEYPMAHDALKVMSEPISKSNTALEHLQSVAMSIVGRGGFICCNLRPEAYFSYVAITQKVAHRFCKNVWHAILRWAHYLLHTKHLRLTYRFTKSPQWCMHSDSSLGNTDEGGSYGGIAFGLEGDSGYVDWRCIIQRLKGDSSVCMELNVATLAAKSLLGFRMMLTEFGLLQAGPTPLYLDAKAVIQGADMERVTREMRFMAVRYAMLRQVVEDKKVLLRKVHTDWNRADIFTKPLVGDAFQRGRAMALGLLPGSEFAK